MLLPNIVENVVFFNVVFVKLLNNRIILLRRLKLEQFLNLLKHVLEMPSSMCCLEKF